MYNMPKNKKMAMPTYKAYGGKTMMPSYKGHGGMMEKARYYQKGAKVAGCMPAQNNPRMTKAK
jgi:hypothetical protein